MKVISVLWHSVDPDSINPEFLNGSNPTASLFREQIRFLLGRYTPISIREFLGLKNNPSLYRSYKKPPILLTFDDGFKNVVNQALPVLNEFGVPALFFVIGEVIRNPEFVPWYVECIHMLRRTRKRNVTYGNASLDLNLKAARWSFLELLDASMKTCRIDRERDGFLNHLAELMEVTRPTASDVDDDLRFVSAADLNSLGSSSLLTVASHGLTHRFLDSLSCDEQRQELEQSHILLSRCSPSYFPALAYPGGSFDSDTIALTKQTYQCAFALCFGASYKNPYTYPRIGIGHDSTEHMAYAISAKRIKYVIPLKRFLHTARIWR